MAKLAEGKNSKRVKETLLIEWKAEKEYKEANKMQDKQKHKLKDKNKPKFIKLSQ